MNKIILTIVGFLIALSCNKGPYPGFTAGENGLYYKIFPSGEDSRKAGKSDIITMQFKYENENGYVIYDSKSSDMPARLNLTDPFYRGDPMEGLALMGKGDSAIFLVPADSFYQRSLRGAPLPDSVKPGSKLKFHIKIENVQTQEEAQKEYEEKAQIARNEESSNIEKYLKENNITVEPTQSGLYFIELIKGTGNKPVAGKNVLVHYTGKFLDGKVFDSSIDRGQPIKFPFGMGQVIKGWDEALSYMQEGGKAMIIVPSQIAYGPSGKGPIPPNTPLVFDVELIEAEQ